ncbi:MAG: ABC transporter permease [candidate division WS1 bacterium]|jgi:lipoprotein-releasing system permease protein|nr:ABC transporter permease [candidate division WS1 bacterium]
MSFELRLALRHLIAGGGQTLLIVSGVAMAVTLVVFISCLIGGLQRNLVDTLTGPIAHVSLEAPQRVPRVPDTIPGQPDALVIASRQQRLWQPSTIDQCRCTEAMLRTFDHVTAVAPAVSGQALLTRAGTEKSVRVVASPPRQQDGISRLQDDLIEGNYLRLQNDETVIGYELAQELGVTLQDRVRLTTGAGISETFRIAGIVYTGSSSVDASTVFITLRGGQTLFGTGTLVTTFSVKLDDPFRADDVGDAMAASLDLEVDTWMRQNPQLLTALRAQTSSATMISVFSLIASSFAIASVLVVSVLKRSKEIGILKALGARRRQVLRVFTLEGLMIGISGSLLGGALGSAFVVLIAQIEAPSAVPGVAPRALFPGALIPSIIAGSMIAAVIATVIASVLPARQAADLDPVEVIRGG